LDESKNQNKHEENCNNMKDIKQSSGPDLEESETQDYVRGKLYYYETDESWYIQLSLICHDG